MDTFRQIATLLTLVENNRPTLTNLKHYCKSHQIQPEILEFCIKVGLVEPVGKNSLDENLYGLTDRTRTLRESGKLKEFIETNNNKKCVKTV